MKINNTTPNLGNVTNSDTKARIARDTAQTTASSGDAEVRLSTLSSRMLQMESVIADTPVVNAAKVAEIKQAITEGRYQVNPEKIADGLIRSVQQMLKDQ